MILTRHILFIVLRVAIPVKDSLDQNDESQAARIDSVIVPPRIDPPEDEGWHEQGSILSAGGERIQLGTPANRADHFTITEIHIDPYPCQLHHRS